VTLSTCRADPPNISRSECTNCLRSMWRNSSAKADSRGRKKLKLCTACEYYSKLTKQLRPFTVPTSPELRAHILKEETEENSEENSEKEAEHTDCFFTPRISAIRSHSRAQWSAELKLACVKGFRNHGKDLDAIASEIDGMGVEGISAFYDEFKLVYRLDMLIQQCEQAQASETTSEALRPKTRVFRLNGKRLTVIERKVVHKRDEYTEFDDSRDKSFRANARFSSRSSMLTRNQKLQRVKIES